MPSSARSVPRRGRAIATSRRTRPPTGAEARRLHRFLRGVERDVRAADTVRVRRSDGGGVTVEMAFGAVRLSRVVTLSREEHALLVEDADMATRLVPEND